MASHPREVEVRLVVATESVIEHLHSAHNECRMSAVKVNCCTSAHLSMSSAVTAAVPEGVRVLEREASECAEAIVEPPHDRVALESVHQPRRLTSPVTHVPRLAGAARREHRRALELRADR